MVKCQSIMDAMNRIAPKRLAEEWDNPGLLVGSPAQPVSRILICLDVSDRAIEHAIRSGVQLIISHHPLIFRPIKQVRTDLPLGSRLQKLLKHDIAVFAAHTNLDIASGGVNDVLAEALGLTAIRPFEKSCKASEDPLMTLGRMGELSCPMTPRKFAEQVKKALPTSYVRLTEAGTHKIRRVALCSGSGAEYIAKAAFLGADAYVTSDVKYHEAQHAMEEGLHLIDAGHFGTEYPIVHALRKRLETELSALNIETELLEDTDARDVFSVIL